ncbi:hypothetical protein ENUP19_0063G0031 [Entamoeba nuttalli]|uniref:Phospholipid-transporting ATPase n=2 Tax=Entamoeba nuttalli TaxID=412467 RepID=A0ABQ0DDZ3_9EUKA
MEEVDDKYNDFVQKMRKPFEFQYKVVSDPGKLFTTHRDFRRWHQKIPILWTYKPFYEPRTIHLPSIKEEQKRYQSNKIENNKYQWWNFIPLAYLRQFKYTYNIFFLVTIITQFIPACKVGYLFQHVVPLVFVLTVAVLKELFDEIHTRIQDGKINNQIYTKLTDKGEIKVKSKDIQVGDIILMNKNERVPADMIALHTTGKNGLCFVKTTQLDGETDWKIRKTVPFTQNIDKQDIPLKPMIIDVEAPNTDIKKFAGRIRETNIPLTLDIENVMWSGLTVAGEETIGVVVYTGKETKIEMSKEEPVHKMGVTERELNRVTGICILLLFIVVLVMTICTTIYGKFTFVTFMRYVILAAPMIPISLRINLEISKVFYSLLINYDPNIPGCSVRNTNLPEALGRVDQLFTDKTGTLTVNEMIFKKFTMENKREINCEDIETTKMLVEDELNSNELIFTNEESNENRLILKALFAMAICHNVTPTKSVDGKLYYQASSPDEIAMVQFVEKIGIILTERDTEEMILNTSKGERKIKILSLIPFSSERKRMGIIIEENNKKVLLMKGAESVLKRMLPNEWCVEKSTELAREDMRTLVFAMKIINDNEYSQFEHEMNEAKMSLTYRDEKVNNAFNLLEKNLNLIGVTGVEDRLQDNVPQTIEILRRADIKIWMLTGDKIETAIGIGQTSTIIPRDTEIITITGSIEEVATIIKTTNSIEKAIVIDGEALQHCLDCFPRSFFLFCDVSKAVICARCSPQQKAEVVLAAKKLGRNTCAVGDGGNDVGMIREADVGIGVEGKEGKQAALAADFSTQQFGYIPELFLWHGRNAYKRTSLLSHIIIHRGIIMTTMQLLYCSIFNFAPLPLYIGWYMIFFTTMFNQLPIIMFITDFDLYRYSTRKFPEIYKQLREKSDLSIKVFYQWLTTSIYEGTMILIISLLLTHEQKELANLSFLVLNIIYLLDCASQVKTWNWYLLFSYVFSFILIFSVFYILPDDVQNLSYIRSAKFYLHVFICLLAPLAPRFISYFFNLLCPPKIAKLERKSNVSFTLNPNPYITLQQNYQTVDSSYSALN